MNATTDTLASTAVWQMLAERWRKAIRAKNLSPCTEASYLRTAAQWTAWLAAEGYDIEPQDVRPYHVDEFIAEVISETSPANGAHHYRNLRVFLGWLVKREELAANPMKQTEPPNVPEKIIPLLTDDEHARVLAVCKGHDFVSRWDTAIILLFIDTGLRVSELAGLNVADTVPPAGSPPKPAARRERPRTPAPRGGAGPAQPGSGVLPIAV